MGSVVNTIFGIAIGMAICTTIIYWQHIEEVSQVEEMMEMSSHRMEGLGHGRISKDDGGVGMAYLRAEKERVKSNEAKLRKSHVLDSNSIDESANESPSTFTDTDVRLQKKINGYEVGKLGQSECPKGIDISYWKPFSKNDGNYHSPFGDSIAGIEVAGDPKFVTFEPDHGGWNNIRMAMETVMVFAHATGRILVMPPEQPLYLLNKEKGKQAHGFGDFFQLDDISGTTSLKIIEMEDFVRDYAADGNVLPEPYKGPTDIYSTSGRKALWAYLRKISEKPKWDADKVGIVFPPHPTDLGRPVDPGIGETASFLYDRPTKKTREAVTYNKELRAARVIHFPADPKAGYRYLTHFYTFLHFQNAFMDRYYRRFIRDLMHYREDIYCHASCVVRQLWEESGGSYASFHIRRGDFQYKLVKLPAEDLYKNSIQQLNKGEFIYIATDERDKKFFAPFAKDFKLRYLDDYFDSCGLGEVNKNYYGMIDQIISAYGRVFFGTWFSTFTGYITRMRGYLGMDDRTNWYFHLPKKDAFQPRPGVGRDGGHGEEYWPETPYYKREWPLAWKEVEEK